MGTISGAEYLRGLVLYGYTLGFIITIVVVGGILFFIGSKADGFMSRVHMQVISLKTEGLRVRFKAFVSRLGKVLQKAAIAFLQSRTTRKVFVILLMIVVFAGDWWCTALFLRFEGVLTPLVFVFAAATIAVPVTVVVGVIFHRSEHHRFPTGQEVWQIILFGAYIVTPIFALFPIALASD